MKELRNYRIYNRYSRTHEKEMSYAAGEVYGDSRFPDGAVITTTAIIRFEENEIETTSGSVYRLDKEAE